MYSKSKALNDFINEIKTQCQPDSVQVCDGSESEYDTLMAILVKKGTAIPLKAHPHSFLVRSDPDDVARVESRTFICSEFKEDAGPTNNWVSPKEMKTKLHSLFAGSMKGRVMYVVPFCMGTIDSPLAKLGVQITDSAYAVCNMKIMTRMGERALRKIEAGASFVPGVHSLGAPFGHANFNAMWPSNPEKYIVHFPETNEIWSFGSGYGGNALLGKKCFALRIASYLAKEEGWLAEHMLILGITNPEGKKRYIAAAFPSSCGKTNLAMIEPSLPGWKVECVGDDIAWMKFGEDGRLYAINPEFGFFGVAPGTSMKSNPNAMRTIQKNTIFTNVALTDEGDVWWEGMTDTPPNRLMDWRGNAWTPNSKEKAAQANSRFTAPIQECPILDEHYGDPSGVPIDAIIFGGRRDKLVPLAFESYGWDEGVFVGASLSSETTAAASGAVGTVRHDPMAMLPFCGYNMGNYFDHWLDMQKPGRIMPKIYSVNWFRKDADGRFIWPGFRENCRLLKWICERLDGKVEGIETPIGLTPKQIDLSGLFIDPPAVQEILEIDREAYLKEVANLRSYFAIFGSKFPKRLTAVLNDWENRLRGSPNIKKQAR